LLFLVKVSVCVDSDAGFEHDAVRMGRDEFLSKLLNTNPDFVLLNLFVFKAQCYLFMQIVIELWVLLEHLILKTKDILLFQNVLQLVVVKTSHASH
jgi:hypothetical protein